MRIISKLAAVAAVVACSGVFVVQQADARRHWNPIGECKDPVEGAATSTGILGLGSERASRAAQSNWEMNVEDKYGPGFANFSNARDIQWDCKKGAVLLAKCVVVAKPCGARLRG